MKTQYKPKESNIKKLKAFFLKVTNESKNNNKDISSLLKK
jgi:hypothetical protein